MNENASIKPNVVEMAKKKRIISIIDKLRKGEVLSKSEIKELEDHENGPNPPGIVDTQEQVAKVFGVSVRSVQYWTRDGMPVQSDGKYSIADIQSWKFHKTPRKDSNTDADPKQKLHEINYQLRLLELKKERKELIPRDQMETELIHISIAVKRKLLALKKTLIDMLYGQEKREMKVILTNEFKQLIKEFELGQIFEKVSRDDIKKVRKTIKTDQHTLDLE